MLFGVPARPGEHALRVSPDRVGRRWFDSLEAPLVLDCIFRVTNRPLGRTLAGKNSHIVVVVAVCA